MDEGLQVCLQILSGVESIDDALPSTFVRYIETLVSLGIKSWIDFANPAYEIPLFSQQWALPENIRILRIAATDRWFILLVSRILNDASKNEHDKQLAIWTQFKVRRNEIREQEGKPKWGSASHNRGRLEALLVSLKNRPVSV